MAQDPSHPSHQEKKDKEQKQEEHPGSSSSSSNNNHESKSWLQLGLGAPSSSTQDQSERQKITELQLFSNPVSVTGQETPGPATHIASTVQVPALEHPTRPFPFFSSGRIRPSAEAGPSASEAGPSTGTATTRVIILPPRPQTGLWFVLRASQNQRREPWLPQISRSFMRIRDGRMTVSMVMKYLVNRLGLEHESQVEITCKGQRLHPAMTLEHVRDNIWCSREAGPSVPSPSSIITNILMTLEYGRSA
ncbi:E3 ubiquitin protein ligase DRIP1 [Carex littledalei]|uniref:E3 ubiquitin protein ligase DRIP1 n=1 Tax=Carex littledalei TaxID=544730 RepID=A0A833R5Q0_9POAL|nr:E3 ubiquitin protein ligase DRIP1 [Carex littledalei]